MLMTRLEGVETLGVTEKNFRDIDGKNNLPTFNQQHTVKKNRNQETYMLEAQRHIQQNVTESVNLLAAAEFVSVHFHDFEGYCVCPSAFFINESVATRAFYF